MKCYLYNLNYNSSNHGKVYDLNENQLYVLSLQLANAFFIRLSHQPLDNIRHYTKIIFRLERGIHRSVDDENIYHRELNNRPCIVQKYTHYLNVVKPFYKLNLLLCVGPIKSKCETECNLLYIE